MKTTQSPLILAGVIHANLTVRSLARRMKRLDKMRKAKEDHAFTKTKGGGVKESGHHRGILMNKEAQDRLAADYARASVDAEYAASYSRRVKEQTTKYFADVGVLSDGDSTMNQPYNAKTSGAVDPTKSEEPSYLTKQIQMDSTIADSSNGAAHTAGHSSKNHVVMPMPMDPGYLNQEGTPDVHRKLYQVGAGSCGGTNSCTNVTSASEIGDGSCTDSGSCYSLNGNVGDGSCLDIGSCAYFYGTVGNGSCTGRPACYNLVGTVGNGSCTANSACQNLNGTVGDGSCTNDDSCYELSGNVGDGSCTGIGSCRLLVGCVGQNSCTEAADFTGTGFVGACVGFNGDIPDNCPSVAALHAGNCTSGTFTGCPTSSPTKAPSTSPSKSPSQSPSKSPSQSPSSSPTDVPTGSPTKGPTSSPSQSPSAAPTVSVSPETVASALNTVIGVTSEIKSLSAVSKKLEKAVDAISSDPLTTGDIYNAFSDAIFAAETLGCGEEELTADLKEACLDIAKACGQLLELLTTSIANTPVPLFR